MSVSELPPGPAWPAPVQSFRMLRRPYEFLLGCHRRYGDWFTVRMIPCGTMVYVADPEGVAELFADPAPLGGVVNAYMSPVLGQGLLTSDGERHAAQRRRIATVFAPERVRCHAGLVETEAAREVAAWPAGTPFPLRPRLEALTLRIIRRLLLGDAAVELESLVPRLKGRGLIDAVLAELGRRLHLRGETARLLEAIDTALFGAIAARRAGESGGEDLLSWLVTARAEDGEPLDDRALRDEIVTLLFAGHETVATTLSWVFERVIRHPRVLERLADAPDDEVYRDAVLKETMRQRACLPDVGRKLTAPLRLGPWRLPAGTQVFAAIVALHMRPDLYPAPDRFDPDRVLAGQPQPWAFLPFGGGVRRCVGAALAMLEMRIILRTVVAHGRFRPAHPAPEEGRGNGVTIVPDRGALVVMERRGTR